MASDDDRPPYVLERKGRWYWEPPARVRRQHGLKVRALGGDTVTAWEIGRGLNKQLAGMDAGSVIPGSVAWLFETWLETDKAKSLADSTQKDYRWLAKRLGGLVPPGMKVALGRLPAAALKAKHADAIYEQLKKEGGATSAHYACRFARRVWKWAARKEHVGPTNPWSGMELPTLRPRKQRWEAEMVPQFVAVACEQDRASIGLAVLLAYWLGHRQGDVLSLSWTALDAKRRETGKTGVDLPMDPRAYPELAIALAETRTLAEQMDPIPEHVVTCEMTGRPWQVDTFRHEFRRIAKLAGIPDELQFRDLRATAITEMEDGGATDIEVTTHSGHLTASMRRRYARRTETQFHSAAEKRLAARERGKRP